MKCFKRTKIVAILKIKTTYNIQLHKRLAVSFMDKTDTTICPINLRISSRKFPFIQSQALQVKKFVDYILSPRKLFLKNWFIFRDH